MSKLDKKIRSLLVSYGELSLQQAQVQQSPTTPDGGGRRRGRLSKTSIGGRKT